MRLETRQQIVNELKNILQLNSAPHILCGQTKGKALSGNLLARAVCGSKAIYNKIYNDTLNECYKACIVVDCSGSRSIERRVAGGGTDRSYDHIFHQCLQMYYYLRESLGKENVTIYIFNQRFSELHQAIGKPALSHKSYADFVQKTESIDALCKQFNEFVEKDGATGGNHDGYSLDCVSKLPFWGSCSYPRRLILHVSDGEPSCGGCSFKGCTRRSGEERNYLRVIKRLLAEKWTLCGIGIENRDLSQYYGKHNCFMTSDDTKEMMQKFIKFFQEKIKPKMTVF